MPARWRITLDRDVVVARPDGTIADVRSRKARAMIALLALRPDHRANRRELTARLWSDRGRDQALASLRQMLTALRSGATGLVDADNESVWIAARPINCTITASGDSFLAALANLDPALDRWLIEARAVLPATELPIAFATRPTAAARQGWAPQWAGWLAAGAVAVGIAYFGVTSLTISSTPRSELPVIAIVPFAAVPNDPTTRAIAERVATDARAWIPGDRATVRMSNLGGDRFIQARKLDADWVISGDVLARDGGVRARVETASGIMLWTKDIDATKGRLSQAGAIVATRLASVVTCALGGPPKHRAPDVLALLMNACDRIDDHSSTEAALEPLRRLAQRAPDDALAQSYYGAGQAVVAWEMAPALARDTRAGARRSLDIAERLDPRVGEQWLGRAMLVEDARAFELSEKYLRQGLAVEPNSSHLNGFLSAYLANTGNGREAEVYALRAVELDPAKLALTSNAARIMVQNGKLREALDLLNAAELRHPHEPDFVWTRIRLLMFGGAPAQARALLDNEAELPGWMDAAKAVELRRIASAIENPESPDAKALARELIARKTDDPASTIVPLAAIGRSDAAIDMGMTEGVDVGLFFFPGAESALRHPRFPEVARYHGLWAYWKATGRWPDICRDPTLPWQCEKTGKPAS